jgi:hypothetical protein
MNIGIILVVLIIILFFAIINRNRDENNSYKEDIEINEKTTNEIEELFFQETSNGEKKYKFLKIDNQFDLMFIKSLFQSEQIPYYVEFENISRMKPGMYPGMYIGDLGNYNLVYILEKDYNDALEVVKNYIKIKKKNRINETDKKEKARNVVEVLLGNWTVPASNGTGGIEIIYKNE